MVNKNQILLVGRVIILTDTHQVLLLRRNETRYYNPGKWELPGGKLVQGITLSDILEKIIHNESNLIVKIHDDNYFCQSKHIIEPGKYKDFTYIEITVPADYIGGTIQFLKEDHTDYVWVNLMKAIEYDLSEESKKALINYMYKKALLTTGGNQTMVVVRALIKVKQRYLFIKRSDVESFGANQWELPGGKIDNLELLHEGLKREVFEETGLLINVDMSAKYIGNEIIKEGKYKGRAFIFMVFDASVRKGNITLSSEHSEFRWFTKNEILKLDLTSDQKIALHDIFSD